jgi:tRNA threonylcarbamoyladenosine biosynthesis protein TsaB
VRLLLMDTCGTEGSVALADTEAGGIVRIESMPGRSASERLITVIRRLLGDAEWRLTELNAIVVAHGPGSFTGVRVGLSAAKGLSEAGEVPLIAVSRLAVLASLVPQKSVCGVLDAGRGEYYAGVYAEGICVREALVTEEELRVMTHEVNAIAICEARVADALQQLEPQLVREPTAADALEIAVRRAGASDFDDVASIDANYLRRTDAEIFAKPMVR